MSSTSPGVPVRAPRLACAVLLLFSCTHVDSPPIGAEPRATGEARSPRQAPNEPAAAAPDAAELAAAKAWTDPPVVRAIAADCGYEPAARVDEDRRNPMSCALEVEQSCVPDPCFDVDQTECKPACKKACDDCSGGCKSSCQACKSGCKDGACRSACATKCAECRQACVKGQDHCTTGTCNAAYDTCRKELAAEWKKSTCRLACRVVVPCAEKCWSRDDSEACVASCKQRLMKGCPERFFGMCLFGATPDG